MSERYEEAVATAMKLPQDERVRLAEALIASLDDEIDADVEARWLAEAERRLGEFRSGAVQGLSAAEAFTRARDSLRR